MHFIVIGGNGFIGRHFVRHLLAGGHKVVVVGRQGNAGRVDGVDQIDCGLEGLASRTDLLDATDVVCHLASTTIPATSSADPLSDIDGNLRPTVALLEAMKAHGNRRILFLSSGGAVYGIPRQTPIAETHPTDPISPYGIGKLAIEKYLAFYREQHGFSPVIIRPANPYGPDQGKLGQLGAVWTFIQKIRNGETATVFGDGSIVRDFVHVDDLCRLMTAAISQGADGVYNCGGGTGTSLAELIGIIEEVTGKRLSIDRQPARPFDPPRIVLDISKARAELGWEPQISLLEGISGLMN